MMLPSASGCGRMLIVFFDRNGSGRRLDMDLFPRVQFHGACLGSERRRVDLFYIRLFNGDRHLKTEV